MIVEKWLSRNASTEIGKELRLSTRQTVSNIVDNYIRKGVHAAGKGCNRTRLGRTDDVINYVEYRKTKPSSFGAEIQNTLVADKVCLPENVPSLASISRILRDDLGYSYKKLSVIPRESQTPQAEEELTHYLTSVANMDTKTMHFFDECSVVKTTGNRHYGHAHSVGKPAIEVQRYASNAILTQLISYTTCTALDMLTCFPDHPMDHPKFFCGGVRRRRFFRKCAFKRGRRGYNGQLWISPCKTYRTSFTRHACHTRN